MTVGDTLQFELVGVWSNGSCYYLTQESSAQWKSDSKSVTITKNGNPKGLATAISTATGVVISSQYTQGLSATAIVDVE